MDLSKLQLAIVGARGAVGAELLALLAERDFPVERIAALGSGPSSGTRLPYGRGGIRLETTSRETLRAADVVFLAAGDQAARQWAPEALESGAHVIDCSAAYRDDSAAALVIPEVNGATLRQSEGRLAAVPNCTTVITLLAATPIRAAFGLERMSVATYQAISGAGRRAVDELFAQSAEVLAGRPPQAGVFDEPCAFNVFSHDSPVDATTGYNLEETMLVTESARIWGDNSTRIAATCMRVPVVRAHCVALDLTLSEPAHLADVRAALGSAPGLELVDDRENGRFPTPLAAAGGDRVLVGRLRIDRSHPTLDDGRARGYQLFAAGDQLRRGAALNALAIADSW